MFSYFFPKKINDLTVVIRGVGERTEKLCLKLLSTKVSKRNIVLINENPFSAALKKSFEIGIDINNKWTLVIDADVLITSTIIEDLYTKAENSFPSVFAIQSEMLDKPFAGKRVGGIKVFRTELLKKAITFIPEAEHRPETHVIKSMHKKGFYVDITDLNCGLHDFEQYYSDLFRKGYTHSKKSSALVPLILPYWERMSKTDKDFETLLDGYNFGLTQNAALKLEKNEVEEEFEKYKTRKSFQEKPPISLSINTNYVDQIVDTFESPPEYYLVKEENDKKGRPTIPVT